MMRSPHRTSESVGYGRTLLHVTARDVTRGSEQRAREAILGCGEVNWTALLRALLDADYRGAITVDPSALPDRLVSARAGRRALADLMTSRQ